MSLYKVDLMQFGIIAGDINKIDGSYTLDQYEQAYNNGIGIQNAINYGYENGYSGIILPKNKYCLTYNRSKIGTSGPSLIFPKSNQEINLNGSIIEVIYDSVNKSPYHTVSTEAAWMLRGTVFEFTNVTNCKIHNGEIKGDIYNRSFTDGGSGFNSEKGMEQTYGIRVGIRSYKIEIFDMNIHGFMGDGIAMRTRSTGVPIESRSGGMIPGFLNEDGTVDVSVEGAYYSENIININRETLQSISPNYPNTIQLQTGGGYTRIPIISDDRYVINFYDVNSVFINQEKFKYLDLINLPKNAVGIKLGLVYEQVDLPSLPYPNFSFTEPASAFVNIRFCSIHDNHRGGISNCADYTTIEKCDIFNNGMDSSIGAPLFPDTTRYAINCEDSISRDVVIRDNNIYKGFNGLLMGCYNVSIENNNISNIRGIIIYNNYSAIIKGNKLFNSSLIGFMNSDEKIKIIITDNVVKTMGKGFDFSDVTGDIIMSNNIIEAINFASTSSAVSFIGNTFILINYPKVSDYTGFSINNARFFKDNYLESRRAASRSTLSYIKGGGNIFIGLTSIRTLNDKFSIGFNDDEFINCFFEPTINYSLVNTEFSISFIRCKLSNCNIRPFGGQRQDRDNRKSSLLLIGCEFNIGNTSPISCISYAFQSIDYLIDMKDCYLKYTDVVKPKLISGLAVLGRNTIKIVNTKVEGNPNFKNLISNIN